MEQRNVGEEVSEPDGASGPVSSSGFVTASAWSAEPSHSLIP